jgi:hypothetical protein
MPSNRPSPTPLAGSQLNSTANTMISSSASQNGGTEMPAKHSRLTL